jgi:peptide/nickel transport system substrate-binding protein
MTKKLLFGLLILALVAVPLLATACEEEVTPPAEEEEEQPPAEEEEVVENWWDEFGEPQYGGTITVRISSLAADFDVTNLFIEQSNYFYESLWSIDWTQDRDVWSYKTNFLPEEYAAGCLADTWEIQPDTIIVHLKEGVHWQNKPPVNGREFTAYDVEAHYARGEVWQNPIYMAVGRIGEWESVTALDNYTVEFKFKSPSAVWFLYASDMVPQNMFEAPEWVALSDEEKADWHNAVGTGPWILADYLLGTSITFSANPDYWGYDERYPENQLPYADEFKVLCIPDATTAIAALRTGQIDILGAATGLGEPSLTWQEAQTLEESNPELEMGALPATGAALDMRCDTAPFTDIRVRKALQMSIDRETIAQTYYGGTVDGTPCGIVSPALTGYCYPYEDWPQELKDEYAYNVEGAKALLAEAAADGVFTPNELGGFDTNVVASSSQDLQLLQIIQDMFKDIGVDMTINEMEYTAFQAFLTEGKFDQMTYGGCGYDTIPTLINHRWSGNTTSNYTYNNDAGYDAIVAQFFAATTMDEAARLQAEADEYAIPKHWSVHLFPLATFIAWQPYLKGYSGESRLNMSCGGYISARLWIDQALKESLGH